uniref:ankyrin repeat domain-containing protein n=2 Tax=Flavobacterium sp. TaxID=239 RepID=UPI00404A27B4
MRIKLIVFTFLLFIKISAQTDIFDIARNGTKEAIEKAFKEDKSIVNQTNAEGYSMLILACYSNNIEVTRFLIKNGADVNGDSKMGTPLMAAVVKNNRECINLLLEKNVDVSKGDTNGSTALHYAVMFKHYEIIPILIKKSADINQKDYRGLSPVDYAIISKDEKLKCISVFSHTSVILAITSLSKIFSPKYLRFSL